MGKIIAVASGKGGTGKPPSPPMWRWRWPTWGSGCLCLDCDITLRNLDLALGLSDRALMDFSDVMEAAAPCAEAAVPHERYPSLSLLTAPMADRPLSLSVPKLQALAREIREKLRLVPDRRARRTGPGLPDGSVHGRPGDRHHHHGRVRHAGRPAHRRRAVPPFPAGRCTWWWGACPKRCCVSCTPPSTTPSTRRACRCWA